MANSNSNAKKVANQVPSKKVKASKKKLQGDHPYVICIGASAGGLNAISEILSHLPVDIPASIFIVLHLSKTSVPEIFLQRLKRDSKLHFSVARNAQQIAKGHVYIAPKDAHLLIKDNHVLIGKGPAENRFRPSIDVLFRSAAVNYGERVIGIVLSGLLNDGTNGMVAIKHCGGHCLVQDPNEAEYPDMPMSVLEVMDVDYCGSLKKMGRHILSIIEENKIVGISPPENIIAEARLSELAATAVDRIDSFGERTTFDCPDCGGSLWEIKNGHISHYRCHVGHSYSEKDLILKQTEAIEQTLWIAVRMMEERKLLLSRIALDNKKKGLENLSSFYQEKSKDLEVHIGKLKSLLYTVRRD